MVDRLREWLLAVAPRLSLFLTTLLLGSAALGGPAADTRPPPLPARLPVVVAPATATAVPPTPRPPSTAELLEQITPENLAAQINQLQAAGSDDPLRGSRYSCTPGNDWATGYLRQQFAALGLNLEPEAESSFTVRLHNGRTCQTHNVIATLPGRDPRLYLVTGHYDSINNYTPGFNGPRADQPAPGADDNATGVASLLAIARVLAGRPGPPGRTIRFIAFGGEENSPNFQGSAVHAQQARQRGDEIAGVFNIDMIGHSPTCDKVVAGASTNAEQRLIDALDGVNQRFGLDLLVERKPEGASDHLSFRPYGYPAIVLTENYGYSANGTCGAFSPNYHRTTDVYNPADPRAADNINLRVVRKVSQLVLGALRELAYD